jgi:hypothetical protein
MLFKQKKYFFCLVPSTPFTNQCGAKIRAQLGELKHVQQKFLVIRCCFDWVSHKDCQLMKIYLIYFIFIFWMYNISRLVFCVTDIFGHDHDHDHEKKFQSRTITITTTEKNSNHARSRSRRQKKFPITHGHDHDDGKSFQSRTITRDRDRDRDREIGNHAKH